MRKKGTLVENQNIENTAEIDENILQVQEEMKNQEMQIAENITITQEEMKQRRFMDIRRW
jgi:hypothetical protein